jgi:serine/threonine-protein kinase
MLPAAKTRFGPYEIIALLGAGGMGEVYEARDTRLDRTVAIKICKGRFTERFEREARAISSLNHPHICALYDIGHEDSVEFLVMEYLEGESLEERLRRGVLPIEEALRIAIQIAGALDAAHRKGVVHRDLKPGNVMLTRSGAKLLDFGLAKMAGPVVSAETETLGPTAAPPITAQGTILGTFQYMSPEQLEGKEADARSDIFSFGGMLYEMITGRKSFEGSSHASLIAAVMSVNPPPVSAIQPMASPALDRLVRRCLAKSPDDRWQSAGDLLSELEWVTESGSKAGIPAPVAARRRSRERLRWAPWIISAVACIIALVASIAFLRAPAKPAPRPLIRLSVDLGPEAHLVNDRGRHEFAISPDGMRIAFSCEGPGSDLRICTRRLDQTHADALAGTEGVEKIFFSPDGQWIGFGAHGKLKKVSVRGGAPIALADAPFDRGASWGEDGSIVAAIVERTGLVRIPENGGTPQPLTELKPGENTHRWPQVLPGAQAVLFTANSQPGDYENASVDVVSLKTGQRRTLQRGGYYGRYLPSGHLVYMHQGTLFAARMDLDRLVLTGPPTPVLEDVDSRSGDGGADFDSSSSGVFVYQSGLARSQSTVQWLEQSGKLQPLISAPSPYKEIHFSPDGKRLALVRDEQGNPDIWVYDMKRGSLTRLTFGGANEGPVWSPGGQYLAYRSGRGMGIWWIRADGSGEGQQLMESRSMQSVTSFSGTHLAFEQVSPASDVDILTAPVEGAYTGNPKAGVPAPFLRTPSTEGGAMFSPDGRWLAYTSDESGSNQVYVRPFRPGMSSQSGSKTQISTKGGIWPMWSQNGRELFYISDDRRIMVASYATKDDLFLPNRPALWCPFQVMAPPATLRMATSSVDLAPDGKRFAVLVPADTEAPQAPTHVNVLLNFFDELARKTGKNP